MKTKLCPKCKRVLPIYKFGVRKQKKWVQSIKKYRVYYHAQSYCYVCRQGKLAASHKTRGGKE